MQASIKIKGFKPGEALSKFLYVQLQSLFTKYGNLSRVELKLSFQENYFQCNLLVSIDGQPLNISLCDNNFYDAVLSVIDFAEAALENEQALLATMRSGPKDRSYTFPRRMSFQFSAN